MKIDALWQEMEAELPRVIGAAWLTRLARPESGQTLLVALEQSSGTRALLFPARAMDIPPRAGWPECRGVEVFVLDVAGDTHLGIRLRDKSLADVFASLAEDIAPRVCGANSAKQSVSAVFDRLRLWQRFLSIGRDDLSVESQRGLWGELHVLSDLLIPAFGGNEAVRAWKAPDAAHQDFQFAAGAIEVKTTTAKQPISVRITSERQLDDAGVGRLFLHVVVLDERDVPMESQQPGQSLGTAVQRLRTLLASDPLAVAIFNDRLLQVGWIDIYAHQYEGRRWTVRQENTFAVQAGFPRLLESQLPIGVGNVSYELSLAACTLFSVSPESMTAGVSNSI